MSSFFSAGSDDLGELLKTSNLCQTGKTDSTTNPLPPYSIQHAETRPMAERNSNVPLAIDFRRVSAASHRSCISQSTQNTDSARVIT